MVDQDEYIRHGATLDSVSGLKPAFNKEGTVTAANAYSSPNTTGVAWHDLLTVSLNNQGSITHVINTTGAATPTNTTPSDVVSYP